MEFDFGSKRYGTKVVNTSENLSCKIIERYSYSEFEKAINEFLHSEDRSIKIAKSFVNVTVAPAGETQNTYTWTCFYIILGGNIIK